MPLKCDLHDYIEIACLFRYEVNVLMQSGELRAGVAATIVRNSANEECLLLELQGDESKDLPTIELVLDTIREMEVLTPDARFKRVSFI